MAQRGFWIVLIAGLAAGCSDSAPSLRDGGVDAASLDATANRPDSAAPQPDAAADGRISADAAVLRCGDGTCSAGEDCASCERDCGACGLWTAQTAPSALDLETVFFPTNSLRGYAAGAEGTLLATSNGGVLWTSVAPTTPVPQATLRAIYFVDALQGVVVGDSGTVLRTVDGGASWTTIAAGFAGALRGVSFVDALHGVAVGDGGAVLRTSDGGASWGSASNGASATLRSVAFADAQHALAVGDAGTIVRSSDGGNTWAPVITAAATASDLRAITFAPGTSTAYAVGADGALIKSVDAGLTWQRLIIDGAPGLRAVAFPVDALHGCVVGDTGVVLRTRDGGASWRRENVRGNPALRGLSFPAHWVHGYAVGRAGVIAKRQPAWDETVLYDTELAGQPRISILPGATPAERVIFAGTSAGLLFALRDFERIPLYRPVSLEGAVGNRAPVGALDGESGATIFVGTKGGFGYAINAADGTVRWRTDGNAGAAGLQPLGDVLAASPVVSPSRNLAFFAARGAGSASSRLFAFDAKTGVCRWVFNGDCDGAVGTLAVGATDAGPIHDAVGRRLYLGSARRAGGATLWAIDAGDSAGGSVLWSRDLGASTGSPAFGEASAPRVSFYFGTADGRLWRVRASDGASCWAASGSTCADAAGAEQAFCTASDARAASCAEGSSVVGGPSPIFSGPSAGNVVFATADGFLRMIDANGSLQWKSAAPISGASAPLVLPEPTNRVYVGSSDGRLYQFSLADGAAQGSRVVGSGSAAVGSPVHAQRLYVSTTDGRIFRFDVPFTP